MTLQEIKNKVNNNIGNEVTIRYNIGRNRIEKYNVKIKEAYKNIFIVETSNKNNIEIKSFKYRNKIIYIYRCNDKNNKNRLLTIDFYFKILYT